jgi:flagellar hook-associated protein 1 FlgK
MANGFGSLYIGASGLQNAQYAINTTANNLANVNTTGYVRQQVRFADKSYNLLQQPMGNVNLQQNGLGVSIGDVVHARDIFLDKAYRQEAGRQSFYSAQYETVDYVEDLMQELNGEEFKESLSDLCEAVQQLSTQPEVTVYQNLVLEKADLLVSRTQGLYADFQNYQSNINDQIKDDVDRVNEIGQRIYDLNIQIQKIEAAGIETAMTLRDERDNLLDELGTYGTVEVKEDATGFTYVDFEHTRFVDDIKAFTIGLKKDTESGTGFYTPYWEHLSNEKTGTYIEVFDTKEKISTDINTDVGGIKSKLIARGDTYGRYENIAEQTYSKEIDGEVVTLDTYKDVLGDADRNIMGSTMVEVEAELDKLFHEIVTQMNNIFAPKDEVSEIMKSNGIELTQDADGNYLDAQGVTWIDKDGNFTTDSGETYNTNQWVALDVENCTLGKNGELPDDLFVRSGSDNKAEVQIDGKTYYLYRKEDAFTDSTRYAIGNVTVNSTYQRQIASMPAYTANGAVDMDFGSALREVWEAESLTLNPTDKNPCSFEEYYNKMVDNLAVAGNTYKSATETLDGSVASYDSARQQVIGVSSDEELTQLIKYQAAYNAASRYMTVISEMTELIVTDLI